MTSVMRKRKQKRALAGEIAEAIRSGGYRGGEWLRQIDLEEKFSATRFDVRAALDELVVLKAIEHVPNRGYRVAEIDTATLRHIRETRVVMETAAVPNIVAAVDAPTLARLRDLAEQFSAAAREGTRADQSRVNSEFHHLMYHLSGNPVMEEMIWNLRDRSRGSNVTVWISHEALLRSDRDHHAMLEALEARDAARLTELISGHILRNDP
ncbi:GntR family transcriptional regulator [Bosea caraganae]|uniref:GntR family transcriptional regulator n=2 Tax=Bosea caraganae TaxID=2763117 RepID=A0A370L1L0_9HYPH|nr:GntR family transcriptional regulator [Bosea caraganae]RDJ23408.1 GntR family transcriptional regulator [Bosea caraganae]